MPAQALTRDDMDRIHRLLSEDITALETERFNALDAPGTRREKEAELEAARATRQRVEAAMAAPTLVDALALALESAITDAEGYCQLAAPRSRPAIRSRIGGYRAVLASAGAGRRP